MNVKRQIVTFLFFLLLSTILSAIWFHKGLIVALGESAMPFYNPNTVLHFYGQTWVPISMGYFPGTTLSSVPFFTLAAWLWNLSLPAYIVQAIFYAAFAFLGLTGGYYLYTTVFQENGEQRQFIGIVGGLFYLLNLISLVIAFNRLQYPFTLFYFSIPFALLVFVLGIMRRKYLYVLYFNFMLAPFSMAYGTLPFLELLWFLLGSYVLFYFFLHWRNKKQLIFPVIFLILCILVWILFNAWWFIQLIEYALFTPHPTYNIKGDIGTFNILSTNQGNLSYVFRLMNEHFLESMKPTWGNFYFTPFFTIITYIIPFLTFFPLLLKKKPAIVYYFLFLALVVLFFTKGSADPFGEIFLFFFSYVKILEVFRNSFEKIGLLLPVAFSPLIAYSTYYFFNWFEKKYNKRAAYTFVLSILIGICGIAVFPFWNSWVFTYNLPPANDLRNGDYVKVPDYYKQANEYLEKDPSISRVLALPMGGEGLTYTWDYAYNGVEYTNGLLGRSAISYTTIMPYLENVTTQLNHAFSHTPESFVNIMNVLNAKYLMIRSDIDYKGRFMPNPENVKELGKKRRIEKLQHEKDFGALQFFKNNDNPDKIYAADDIYSAPITTSYHTVFSQTAFGKNDVILNIGENPTMDSFAYKQGQTLFLEPDYSIDYSFYPSVTPSDAQNMLPVFYRFLPPHPLFKYVLLKEKTQRNFTVDNEDKMFYDFDVLARRLGELQRLALDRNETAFVIAKENYLTQLSTMQKRAANDYESDVKRNINNFRYRTIGHEVIVANLITSIKEEQYRKHLQDVKRNLDIFARKTHVKPLHGNHDYESEKTKRIIYHFDVPEAGNYEVVLSEDGIHEYYDGIDSTWQITLNTEMQEVVPEFKNGWISFGTYDLKRGGNEVHLFTPQAKNLITEDTTDEIRLTAKKRGDLDKVSFPISNFDFYASHKISFSYRLNRASGAQVQTETEFDHYNSEGKYVPQWSTEMAGTHGKWQDASYVYFPYTTASKQTLSFTAAPVNTCLAENQLNTFASERCRTDDAFRNKYFQETDVRIKDVRLERMFTNKLSLIKQNERYAPLKNQPKVSYQRISPTKYSVKISNATKPFLLVFSETFYPEWEAIFTDTNKKVQENNHYLVNTYANAWYINRAGDYEMTIEFAHERLYTLGRMISIPSMLVSAAIILYCYYRRKGKSTNAKRS